MSCLTIPVCNQCHLDWACQIKQADRSVYIGYMYVTDSLTFYEQVAARAHLLLYQCILFSNSICMEQLSLAL